MRCVRMALWGDPGYQSRGDGRPWLKRWSIQGSRDEWRGEFKGEAGVQKKGIRGSAP